MHQDIIIKSLIQERVIKSENDVQFSHVATPEFMGVDAWAYAVDLDSLDVPLVRLHKQGVLDRISANLGGRKVFFANTQGFAFIIKNERVSALEPVDLLSVCQEPDEDGRLHDVWVYGVKGAGKTALIQYIVKADIAAGRRVFVADPKPSIENDWNGAKEYGNGYQYQEIDECIAAMESALNEYGRTGVEVPYTFVLDEWYSINKRIPDAAARVMATVTIARTAGIRTIIGTHSERVKAAGVEGEGDLVENFNIKVALTKNGNIRRAQVDHGFGYEPARHPGPFISRRPAIIDSTPGEALTEVERRLILFACRHNGGSFAVSALHEEIKERLPAEEWSAGGPLTHHRLRGMLEDFERRGLLETVSGRRQPTKKLWGLLGNGGF